MKVDEPLDKVYNGLENCKYHTNYGDTPYLYCARRTAECLRAFLKLVFVEPLIFNGVKYYFWDEGWMSSSDSDSD